jgi:hypothetical protein
LSYFKNANECEWLHNERKTVISIKIQITLEKDNPNGGKILEVNKIGLKWKL